MDKTDIRIPLGTKLRDAQKTIIDAIIRHAGGNIVLAAKLLGIDRSTLYSKIEKYKIQR